MFAGKARACPSKIPFSFFILAVAPGLLALPTNIPLGWKNMPLTNTVAYYKNS
jgi:hypothetical protein